MSKVGQAEETVKTTSRLKSNFLKSRIKREKTKCQGKRHHQCHHKSAADFKMHPKNKVDG